jgi:hypothetical protein
VVIGNSLEFGAWCLVPSATSRWDVLRQNRAVADAEGTINAETTMQNKI